MFTLISILLSMTPVSPRVPSPDLLACSVQTGSFAASDDDGMFYCDGTRYHSVSISQGNTMSVGGYPVGMFDTVAYENDDFGLSEQVEFSLEH